MILMSSIDFIVKNIINSLTYWTVTKEAGRLQTTHQKCFYESGA